MKVKTKTTPGIIIGILILISLIFLAMYFSTNRETFEQITKITSTPSITVTLIEESPEVETVEVSDISDKNIVFFIDKDFDGNRSDEAMCEVCKDITLIASDDPYVVKDILKTDRSGKLSSDVIGDNNYLWTVDTVKSIAVVPTQFGFDDGVGDIEIPVWNLNAVVAGVNSNIVTIEPKDNGLIYSFTKLVPVMKTSYSSQNPIYLKIILDPSNPSNYLIFKGIINSSSEGFDFVVDITDPTLKTISSSESNIEFLVF